eukprot:6181454-Pleurochrysis_carterae.AAC.1
MKLALRTDHAHLPFSSLLTAYLYIQVVCSRRGRGNCRRHYSSEESNVFLAAASSCAASRKESS